MTLRVGAVLLGGCSVGEDYLRPGVPIPISWATPPEAASAVTPPEAAEGSSLDWWRQFRSPRLDVLMKEAVTANFDIAAAVARVRQADAQMRIAGAPLLPSVSGTAGTTRQHQPNMVPNAPPGAKAAQSTSFNFGLGASYEIDFWGKNAAAEQSAEATATASRFDQQTVALTAQSSVGTTYFDFLGMQDRIAVAKVNLANAKDVLAAIQDRAHAGLATSLDVAQQESVVANQRASIPPLEQQQRQDLNALAILIGRLPEDIAGKPGTLDEITVPQVVPGLPSELLARRPDVRNAEAKLIAANADITVTKASLFPSVQLTAQGGFESLALSTLMASRHLLFSLASSVTQPIFNNAELEGQIELKKARYDELVQDYRKSVVSAFSDVENALIATQKTGEEEQTQRVAADIALRAYQISKAQLTGGIIDITSVLNTQRTLFQAQDALIQAKLAHLQAVVGLFKAMGGGWEAK
ncbi:MAG: efflux transporter outer membrane subunit [Alphaproteobacteria bacterium]|nr:efflux transporter outer membrane subunit [Alphaproteobacteria bacterium]